MRYFCTLFDSNYLLKGLAMLRSLEENCPSAHVYVLCMDDKTLHVLKSLELAFITCVPLADVEDEELLQAKQTRGVAEYCWTLSSCFTWHVIQTDSDIDLITYLDSDLLFYSSVAPLFEEIGQSSIAIIEHRFSPRLRHLEVNGRFCVEWVSFRRDDEGLACLSKWRRQCIDWCYYKLEDDRMGDQKYLDEWPDDYKSCHIIEHIGAGVAPWNYEQYHFRCDEGNNVLVNDNALIFYHFHQFQLLDNGRFYRLSTFYTDACSEPSVIYDIYERSLEQTLKKVREIDPIFSAGLKPVLLIDARRRLQSMLPKVVKNFLRRVIRL